MERIAELLTDYVERKGVITEEERHMYQYGFEITIEMMLSLFISFLIASVLHMPVEGILFFVVFIPLRIYAGGLHLDSYWACLTLSCLTFVVILLVTKYVTLTIGLGVLAFVGLAISVWMLYPIEHSNRPVDTEENTYFKGQLLKYLLFDFMLIVVSVILKKDKYILLIVTTFSMVVLTMFIGKFKYWKGQKNS